MTDPEAGLTAAMSGTAILATCIVQTLNESDPTFQTRFLKRLSDAYQHLKDNPRHGPSKDVIHELEMLSWTRELLTGFNFSTGQGKPFLKD